VIVSTNIYNNCGINRGLSGDSSGAIGGYTRAIALNPRSFEAYANRAKPRLNTGDKVAALADLQAASQIQPNDPQVAIERGHLGAKWS